MQLASFFMDGNPFASLPKLNRRQDSPFDIDDKGN